MSTIAHSFRSRHAVRGRTLVQRLNPRVRPWLSLLAAAIVAAVPLAPAHADSMRQALNGVDAVSLRDAGRTIGGDPSISTRWKGHEWRFANEANRATFEANPRIYAPGFGGNCPVALSEGERRPGQPELFVVIGKTLYLTSSTAARQRLGEDPSRILEQAAGQWKRLGR